MGGSMHGTHAYAGRVLVCTPRNAEELPTPSGNDEEAVPVIGLRRKIAERMQDAKRRIPHFAYVEEVDVTALEELRAELNGRFGKERGKLTLLPFLIKAMVRALPDFPQINARFDDDNGIVRRHEAVHVGIATQTPTGLVVPVVRHAEALDLWAAAGEVARLAAAARDGKATREELSGSTITITSLGALGGLVTTPVINYPEVAIVGVNKMVERPMIRDGQVVARKMMNLSSSFDHRVVDGWDAAEFVQRLRASLEKPTLVHEMQPRWNRDATGRNAPRCSSSEAGQAAMSPPSGPGSSASIPSSWRASGLAAPA